LVIKSQGHLKSKKIINKRKNIFFKYLKSFFWVHWGLVPMEWDARATF